MDDFVDIALAWGEVGAARHFGIAWEGGVGCRLLSALARDGKGWRGLVKEEEREDFVRNL